MANRILLVALAAVLAGAGVLYAQPGDTPTPPEDKPQRDIADVTVPGEKKVELSAREMNSNADDMIKEMEGFHRSVLEGQAQAKQSKDVIKLNCVNEKLLAVKQLLNIAEAAENELDEAIVRGDRDEQIHQYGKITISHDNAENARNEARNCIGEDLHFIGKNDVSVTGPVIKNDPTDDGDVGEASGDDPFQNDVGLEDPAYASPVMPL